MWNEGEAFNSLMIRSQCFGKFLLSDCEFQLQVLSDPLLPFGGRGWLEVCGVSFPPGQLGYRNIQPVDEALLIQFLLRADLDVTECSDTFPMVPFSSLFQKHKGIFFDSPWEVARAPGGKTHKGVPHKRKKKEKRLGFPGFLNPSDVTTVSLHQFINHWSGFPTPALVSMEVSAHVFLLWLWFSLFANSSPNFWVSSLCWDLTSLTDQRSIVGCLLSFSLLLGWDNYVQIFTCQARNQKCQNF